MNRFSSLRQVIALLALGMLSVSGPVTAAQAGDFDARGTFTVTNHQGNATEGVIEGLAAPGGRFTGHDYHRATGNLTAEGVASLDFGGGSLLIAYALDLDETTNLFIGTYAVIDGTGVFEGASGGGDMIVERARTGNFVLRGTLDW